LFFTLSFAQNNEVPSIDAQMTKKNSVLVVDYLAQELKLNSKQKSIFMNAFSEYANQISIAHKKINTKNAERYRQETKSATSNEDMKNSKSSFLINTRKDMSPYVLRFTEKRNSRLKEVIRGKQLKKFNEIQRFINPLTLELNIKELNKKGINKK
jgi:hypothetical protein